MGFQSIQFITRFPVYLPACLHSVVPCFVSCLALFCFVFASFCLVLSCLGLSCLVLACLALICLVLSCDCMCLCSSVCLSVCLQTGRDTAYKDTNREVAVIFHNGKSNELQRTRIKIQIASKTKIKIQRTKINELQCTKIKLQIA